MTTFRRLEVFDVSQNDADLTASPPQTNLPPATQALFMGVDSLGKFWINGAQVSGGGGSSVSVNGSVVATPNFNATTPAASGSRTNVVWAFDGSGNISASAQLAITKSSVASNWLNSYNASTGVFTASQPSFADISSGAIANGTTATTQAALSNDTAIATDAYVDGAVAAGPTTFEGAGNGAFLTPWGEDIWPSEGTLSTTVTGTTAFVILIKIIAPITIRKCSFFVQTGVAAAFYYMAVYTFGGNLVANSQAKFTATATGQQNVTLGTPYTLAPGMYYLYFCGDTAALAVPVINFGSAAVPTMLNTNVIRRGTAANGISGGAVPSTLGVLTTSTTGKNLMMLEA